MLWTILGGTYISSNAVDNPGVIYGCLHIYICLDIYLVISSMVVYIYIQSCCGQSWVHLWLSTYISSNAVDNPGVIYGCLHIYPVMLWTILGSSMVSNAVDNPGVIYTMVVVYIYMSSTYISSNAVDNPGVIYGCLHIYPYNNAVDNTGVIYGCLHIYMLWTISMVVYIYI